MYDGLQWDQLGPDIGGLENGEMIGWSVDIVNIKQEDGVRLVVGGKDTVRVYGLFPWSNRKLVWAPVSDFSYLVVGFSTVTLSVNRELLVVVNPFQDAK